MKKSKEQLYITVIKNLLKQIKCRELFDEFNNGFITEEELEAEIDAHPEKYVVDIKLVDKKTNIDEIIDIANKIGASELDLSCDEVATMFSLDTSQFTKAISFHFDLKNNS